VRFGEEEKAQVLQAFDDNWLSPRGPKVPVFGEKWASVVGKKYGWPQCSGTGSLHVALLALGVGPGDKVLVPSYTCSPGVFPVSYTGATPVFIDCETELYGMDPEHLKAVLKKMPKKPKAAIPVHLYGSSCRGEVLTILKENGILIIEDACESVGSTYFDIETDKLTGGLSDVGCFSFRGDKVLTAMGTGGITLTDDPKIHERIKFFTDLGLHNTKTMGRYRDLAVLGFNYEISNPACAFGIAQIDRMGEINNDRRQVARWWVEELAHIPGLKLMPLYAGHVHYQWPIWFSELNGLAELDALGENLLARGVALIPPFWPMHMQPQYRDRHSEVMVFDCPRSVAASEHVIMFPCYPDLSHEQVRWLAGQIASAYGEVLCAR